MRLWDLEQGETIRELGSGDSLQCVSVHWASQSALSGHGRGNLRLWDLEGGEIAWEYASEGAAVQFMVVDWPSQCALSVLVDGALQLWDLERGRVIRRLEGHAPEQVTCAMVDWASGRAITA